MAKESVKTEGQGYTNEAVNGRGGNTNNKNSSNTGGNSGSGGGNTVYTPGPEINFNTQYHNYDKDGKVVSSTLNNDIEKTLIDYLYRPGGQAIDSDINEELSFQLPDYGYDRHLMDIRNWQKQLVSFGAEPGWFFFKIFFNFHTNYGLLGGMLKMVKSKKQIEQEEQEQRETYREQLDQDMFLTSMTKDMMVNKMKTNVDSKAKIQSANTAFGYLCNVCTMHKYERIYDRILALVKFAGTLKDISLRTPWVFRSISGLNTINQTYTEDLDKEKSFVIGLAEETLDQRIGTLIDLYKFAAFDQINCKEIIPANLRKFETTIMVYHMPLKYTHTKLAVGEDAAINGNGVINAASTTADPSSEIHGFDNMMSFKMYTFLNCEIDTETLGEYYPDGVSNEAPFQIGKNGLKIKYDRVYEHRMNEWNEMFFGSDGFYYNNDFDLIDKDIVGTEISEHIAKLAIPNNSAYRRKMNAMTTHKTGIFDIAEYTDLILGKYYGMGYHIRMGVGDLIRGIQGQWNDFSGRINGIKERWAADSRRLSTTHPAPQASVRP